MARTKGSVVTHDNKEVKQYMLDFYDYEDVPRWLDDCIVGALGQAAPNTMLTPYRFFRALQCLDEISTITVGSLFNRKAVAMGDKPLATRTIEYYTKIIRCASQAVAHHSLFNSKFGSSGKKENTVYTKEEYMPVKKYEGNDAVIAETDIDELQILSVRGNMQEVLNKYDSIYGVMQTEAKAEPKENPFIGVVLSEEQKAHVRMLALSGKLEEMNNFIKSC